MHEREKGIKRKKKFVTRKERERERTMEPFLHIF